MTNCLKVSYSVAGLIPHQPPALCVERVLSLVRDEGNESNSLVEAFVPNDGPYLLSGKITPEYFVELLAQSFAAVQGIRNKINKSPIPKGMLAAVDNLSVHQEITPGDRLIISLQKTLTFGSISVFQGTVQHGDCVVADGTMKIWHEKLGERE